MKKCVCVSVLLTFSAMGLANDKERDAYLANDDLERIQLPTLSAPVPEEGEAALTHAIERKEIIEEKAINLPFVILPHRPNYIMPFVYTETPHDEEYEQAIGDEWPGYSNVEAMFQISVKYQIHQFDEANKNRLYVAYTNRSFWQVYNERISRPFRETNHEPELFLQLTPNWGYINQITLSLNHQSNGQYQVLSRSWNRIIAGFYHRDGNSVYGLEPWWRIPETDKADPNDPTDNDNPDISKYLGYGNFLWYKKVGREGLLLRLGNNFDFDNNRGYLELDFTFPMGRRFLGFVQYFEGYGNSLIEYNRYQRRIGIGIKISDYL